MLPVSSNFSLHPYIPSTLHLPHFTDNTFGVEVLLGLFAGVTTIILYSVWNLVGRWRSDFSALEKAKICWFSVSGLIHLVIEGYFASFHGTLAGSDHILAQIWKEYAKGDSRYISSDAFTVVMETFTAAVDGPLCLWTVYAYIRNKPYVHVLQILVSTAQFYGDILYMLTEWFDGFMHGPPFHPLYFYGYFVTMNSFWLIIPMLLIMESSWKITQAFIVSNRHAVINGNTKKPAYRQTDKIK
ncbi:3-beta-hydroxysteroid-Delta(8),Delta(7)-isomerase-like [Paramacrobiotus metropolitanus]|uniref:3-beta-hydroxysteroid-Delta(8), Delta(7)-isomerase-like n=1 Tax=Paramacrobiotus metropolitanus TaxID=2943436 RepID=UPI0024459A0E|nr:3-beta-hydroxysteroid-Delta(8),Delta(7)-isomerase-like [Paramacrobiotus metropolitanus]